MHEDYSISSDTPKRLSKMIWSNITNKYITAQVTLISRTPETKPEWIYINMSSYDFWDDVLEPIREKYNTSNLGGWLFKMEYCDIIDAKFRSIIEAT